jgi:putative alpha-1,2-mannosidase
LARAGADSVGRRPVRSREGRLLRGRLDAFFTDLNDGPSSRYAFLGNEPNLNSPWLYDWLGEPYRTQQVLRRALMQLYPDIVGGFPGNDDLGTMSAWYVFAALGMYPEIPGTDVLALATPAFRDVTLHLPHGEVRLRAPRAGSGAPYVHGLTVDGRSWSRPWIRLSRLRAGTTLRYRLSPSPSGAWGAGPHDGPPSFAPTGKNGCR